MFNWLWSVAIPVTKISAPVSVGLLTQPGKIRQVDLTKFGWDARFCAQSG
jgi:hypothetical protein